MKPILLALGLFAAFLLLRSTLTVQAQHVFGKNVPARHASVDSRARRLAALEAQEYALGLRQREVETQLELTAEGERRLANQIDREVAEPDAPENPFTLDELTAQRTQLTHKKRELRQELEHVQTDRVHVQEEWRNLTGVRLASR